MNKYWKRNVNLVEIGKHKGHKDDIKLLQCVNKLKQKYNSLRQASHLADEVPPPYLCKIKIKK